MASQWIHDKHVSRGVRRRIVDMQRDILRAHVQLSERAGKRQGVPGHLCAAFVGPILSRARHSHLDQHRRDRRDDHHDDKPKDIATALFVAVAIAAEDHRPLRHLRQITDRAGQGRRDRAHENIGASRGIVRDPKPRQALFC